MYTNINEIIDRLTKIRNQHGDILVRIGTGKEDEHTSIASFHVEDESDDPKHVWVALY